MKYLTRRLALLLILLAALPIAALAGGRTEQTPAEETPALTVLILRAAGARVPTLSARLSMEIPPYLWNDFSVRDSRIETESDQSYRETGSVGTSTERIGNLDIERIDLRITLPRETGGRAKTVRVSFELSALLGPDGSVIAQPGVYALLRAIGDSGRTSGRARVTSMSRSGSQGFVAEVMVR